MRGFIVLAVIGTLTHFNIELHWAILSGLSIFGGVAIIQDIAEFARK